MEKGKCYRKNECNQDFNRSFCSQRGCCRQDSCVQKGCPDRRKEKITLEAWAHGCGIIFPCGYVKVPKGNEINFLIKAEEGYCIQDVMVDCERITDDQVVIECQDKYVLSFQHVTCGHRIEAYFIRK